MEDKGKFSGKGTKTARASDKSEKIANKRANEAAAMRAIYEAISLAQTGGEKNLVDGAILMCNLGSAPQKLKVTPHNIVVAGVQQANKTDCVTGKNIFPFGVCSVTKKPCIPSIVGEWMATNKVNKVNGQDSITMESILVCVLGGLIGPLTSGEGMVAPTHKPNPQTGAPNPNAQNKAHLCWATCASIMVRDKGLSEEMTAKINEFAKLAKTYYKTADAWKPGGNGILPGKAGLNKHGYYIDEMQDYINRLYGDKDGKDVSISQHNRNQAIEDLTGEKTTMVGYETYKEGQKTYERPHPNFFLDNDGNVDKDKVQEHIIDKLENGCVILDAYLEGSEGEGHSYIVRRDDASDCSRDKIRLFDPYTGLATDYFTEKLFKDGFPGDIFKNDPPVTIKIATSFTKQEETK